EYTRIIAEEMMREFPKKGLTQEKINMIVLASSLHDIGKIAITDRILLKPGKLTDKELNWNPKFLFAKLTSDSAYLLQD
ncbi:MAG: hypothetical protein Q4D76_20060, partial [Oscillospiraceae bacterium]|nr:hypothetical protein [Oscillospiraceae bacterium]